MTVDSKLETAKARMGFVTVFGLASASFAIAYLVPEYFTGAIIFGILFLVAYLYMHFLQLYYVYFSDAGDKITVRFYYSHPFMRKYKAIEIPKNALAGAEIKTGFFGKKIQLILVQRTAKGEIKYPPVSLSLLSAKKQADIVKALQKLADASKNQPINKPRGKYY